MNAKELKIVNEAKLALFRAGKKQSFVNHYQSIIEQEAIGSRVETLMLFFAETLYDKLKLEQNEIMETLREMDRRMFVFGQEGFDLDELRLRVFGKTQFSFAMNKEDQKYIAELLNKNGYEVEMRNTYEEQSK